MKITIREAKVEDAKKLLDIYAYYVENTAITFEHEVPSLEEFEGRIRDTLCNYPYLVAEAEGEIVGYAYAGRFRTRASYAWSAATSIYVDKRFHRAGIGREMIEYLIELAKQIGFEQMDLEVVDGNDNAKHLYEKCGFVETGKRMRALKDDDGTYRDEILMYRVL